MWELKPSVKELVDFYWIVSCLVFELVLFSMLADLYIITFALCQWTHAYDPVHYRRRPTTSSSCSILALRSYTVSVLAWMGWYICCIVPYIVSLIVIIKSLSTHHHHQWLRFDSDMFFIRSTEGQNSWDNDLQSLQLQLIFVFVVIGTKIE